MPGGESSDALSPRAISVRSIHDSAAHGPSRCRAWDPPELPRIPFGQVGGPAPSDRTTARVSLPTPTLER